MAGLLNYVISGALGAFFNFFVIIVVTLIQITECTKIDCAYLRNFDGVCWHLPFGISIMVWVKTRFVSKGGFVFPQLPGKELPAIVFSLRKSGGAKQQGLTHNI